MGKQFDGKSSFIELFEQFKNGDNENQDEENYYSVIRQKINSQYNQDKNYNFICNDDNSNLAAWFKHAITKKTWIVTQNILRAALNLDNANIMKDVAVAYQDAYQRKKNKTWDDFPVTAVPMPKYEKGDREDELLLNYCVKKRKLEALKGLLEVKNLVIDVKDWYHQTPLMHAAASGQHQVVKLLLKYDKNIINKENDSGDTALHYAFPSNGEFNDLEHITEDSVKTIDILLKTGADITKQGSGWKTPLSLFCEAFKRYKSPQKKVLTETSPLIQENGPTEKDNIIAVNELLIKKIIADTGNYKVNRAKKGNAEGYISRCGSTLFGKLFGYTGEQKSKAADKMIALLNREANAEQLKPDDRKILNQGELKKEYLKFEKLEKAGLLDGNYRQQKEPMQEEYINLNNN